MTPNDASHGTRTRLVDELDEDLVVAIREFTERHPAAEPSEVRRALRMVERRTDGWRPRLGWVLALLGAFGSGVGLGLMLR